ncbi:hypothetical protein CARUB_v10002419mg [Capsella rubella]|uniref:Uncharacterized protein n=1 Tax=Capsella rubella TaxID=81985 RepID=R0HDW8_9BRAS|nr:uncharacterized protein LOC17881634 [Capsella rubella]EOA21933.1 hypothetical protein CARUB_v10002419mg [Capsella rubella]
MKMKKKGKVYPSPPPPSSSSPSSSSNHLNEEDDDDVSLSVLKLLPATILVLVSVLSAEDRQVLAYLITRGTTISDRGNCGRSSSSTSKKKSSKNHKPPVFDCECFDCYTNYWFRWDSSPNRELIHEIIEAFENHHTGGDNNNNNNSASSRNKSNKRGKKKEKPGRRVTDSDYNKHQPGLRVCDDKDTKPVLVEPMTTETTTVSESRHVSSSPARLSDDKAEVDQVHVVEEEESKVVVLPAAGSMTAGHKGIARKVLPDVLGLFNSNFWRLWNPNA